MGKKRDENTKEGEREGRKRRKKEKENKRTLENSSPSLMRGTVGGSRLGFIIISPLWNWKMLD